MVLKSVNAGSMERHYNHFSISLYETCSTLLLTLMSTLNEQLMSREQKTHLRLSSIMCTKNTQARFQQVLQSNNMNSTKGLCFQVSSSLSMATADDFGQHKLRDNISGRWYRRITAVGKHKSRSGLNPVGHWNVTLRVAGDALYSLADQGDKCQKWLPWVPACLRYSNRPSTWGKGDLRQCSVPSTLQISQRPSLVSLL